MLIFTWITLNISYLGSLVSPENDSYIPTDFTYICTIRPELLVIIVNTSSQPIKKAEQFYWFLTVEIN